MHKGKIIRATVRFLGALLFGSVIMIAPAHAAALTISGDKAQTITSDQTITGDILLSGNAKLTIRNATVTVARGSDQPRASVELSDNAQLVIENGALVPPLMHPDNLYLDASGHSRVTINNSTFINVINLNDYATVVGNGARIISSAAPLNIDETAGAFGIVQLAGNTSAEFTDSTIGSFALFFDKDDDVELANLKPQLYKDFNLQRDAAKFSPHYNIILKNTSILPVKLHGPFERSWAIFVDPATKITIKDSSLNKLVFSQFNNETLSFKDLRLDKPQPFDFRGIHFINTSVANEWGFMGKDSSINVENSKGVWLWPIGTGNWNFKNSHMIEFDPRDFTGVLHLDNSEWANAGEVFEGTKLTFTGTYYTSGQLNEHLALSADSSITREFPFTITDETGRPSMAFTATVWRGGKQLTQLKSGVGNFTVPFTPENYKQPLQLKVVLGGKSKTLTFDLFSSTPLSLSYKDSPALKTIKTKPVKAKTVPDKKSGKVKN